MGSNVSYSGNNSYVSGLYGTSRNTLIFIHIERPNRLHGVKPSCSNISTSRIRSVFLGNGNGSPVSKSEEPVG